MWDRLRTQSAVPPGTTTNGVGTAPNGFLRVPSMRSGAGVQKQRLARLRGAQQHAGRHGSWHDDLDDPLNALGISNAPYKYEIRRGKVVPQASHVDVSLPSHDDVLAAAARDPPPRNPRRRTKQLSQHQQVQNRSSSWRPASSVYDQSDTNGSDRDDRLESPLRRASGAMYGQAADTQISPPSSPDTAYYRNGHMTEDVSPIDEDYDLTQQEMVRGPRQATQPAIYQEDHRRNLPTMRSERRGPPRGAGAPAAPQMRGPTPNDVSRMRQVHPGQRPAAQADETRLRIASGDGASHLAPAAPSLGSTTTISGPQPGRNTPSPSFGQRMRMMGRSRPEPVDDRPPWQGASGRSKVVQPIRDDVNAAPLNVPRRSSKRAGRGEMGGAPSLSRPSGPETSNVGAASRRPIPLTSNQKASKMTAMASSPSPPPTHPGAGAQAYPSPPDFDSLAPSPPPAAHPSTDSPPTTTSPYPDALPTLSVQAIKRKPPPSGSPSSATPARAWGSSSLAQPHLAPNSASTKHSTAQDTWVQPPSRFSVTTFATSNPGSPLQSTDEFPPEVPALPALQTSVMDRRRPFSGANRSQIIEEPIVISMNSPYSAVDKEKQTTPRHAEYAAPTHVAGDTNSTADCRSSILSMAKPLPVAPHEMSSSEDRVAHLSAQIQGLSHRRLNINKSIQQMTELMPTDNLLASDQVLRKRETEKQKVEALKEELSEVQREEYDLGLKLHRAYKRLDKDAEYEPTTLWVRRVTN